MKELLAIADAKFGVYKKKAFSEILGITNDRFLKICSGDEQPSTNELAKISECLGVAFYLKGGEIRVVIDNNQGDYNGRGYKIVADYEVIHFRTAQSYIRATTLQVCTTTAMFYSLCQQLYFIDTQQTKK